MLVERVYAINDDWYNSIYLIERVIKITGSFPRTLARDINNEVDYSLLPIHRPTYKPAYKSTNLYKINFLLVSFFKSSTSWTIHSPDFQAFFYEFNN